MPPLFHLSLGSNLGDRESNLARAVEALRAAGFEIDRLSSIYETEPVGEAAGPDWFLNAAAAVAAPLSAADVLARCLSVEQDLGRKRTIPGGPRTVDLDLLLAGDQILEEDGLVVPHPRMHTRRFVLVPLAEIAESAEHPLLRVSVGDLLRRCEDRSRVVRYGAFDASRLSFGTRRASSLRACRGPSRRSAPSRGASARGRREVTR